MNQCANGNGKALEPYEWDIKKVNKKLVRKFVN